VKKTAKKRTPKEAVIAPKAPTLDQVLRADLVSCPWLYDGVTIEKRRRATA